MWNCSNIVSFYLNWHVHQLPIASSVATSSPSIAFWVSNNTDPYTWACYSHLHASFLFAYFFTIIYLLSVFLSMSLYVSPSTTTDFMWRLENNKCESQRFKACLHAGWLEASFCNFKAHYSSNVFPVGTIWEGCWTNFITVSIMSININYPIPFWVRNSLIL